jgi:uncharacterized protein YcbK (DUF882 family)
MTWNRRRVLQGAGLCMGAAAAGLLVGRARSQPAEPHAKRIALLNLHTSEHLDIEYFRDGAYLPSAIASIEVLLRDFRTGERHSIDPLLMDYLVDVARNLKVDASFSVISGYRSPQTNQRLRSQSHEVAQHSLHMEGRAIDVRMGRIDCAQLAAQALDMKRGGVGYYRSSDFVHLDTGAFRTWRG